jgi:uncharacterized integral membrane protein
VKRLSWIITLPITLAAVVFAVANRKAVTFDLWPLDQTVTLPLFVAILGSLFLGLLVGGLIAWLSAGRAGLARRRAERRAAELEREIARLKREAGMAAGGAAGQALPPVTDEPGAGERPRLPSSGS